ncbi:MAG: TetR family transcriptional regulator C-terminal domain-containing protein [Arenibacterium sp.]
MTSAAPQHLSRIQKERREEILSAALEIFSKDGFRGASINAIAKQARMSTPRLLYHFSDKGALYRELLRSTMLLWLGPLKQIEATGEPVDEVLLYIKRKLQMSQAYPRESRLFASEVLLGLGQDNAEVFEPLRQTFEEKIVLLSEWMKQGKLARQDPYHLIYSIWATTQHYADFEAQIAELSPDKIPTLFQDAEDFLIPMYRKLLTP